jgi:hypothetical protein
LDARAYGPRRRDATPVFVFHRHKVHDALVDEDSGSRTCREGVIRVKHKGRGLGEVGARG